MINTKIKIALCVAACVVVCSMAVLAQVIHLSIPDTVGKRGDTLLIPVRVSTLGVQDSVYSGQVTLTYNSGVINIFDIQKSGTALQNIGSVSFSPTSRIFAFFSSDSIIKGSGILIYFKVAVQSSPSSSSTSVGFSSAFFNEGKPDTTTTTNGSVRILSITLSPKSPSSSLVVGDSLQFFASGDTLRPFQWTSSDTSVATIDATGKLRARGVGQAKVYVQDARSLKDSSNLIPIFPPSLKSLTVSIRDTSYTKTLFFNLPIYISNVTGLGIISSQFALTYNGSILQAFDVIKTNSMTSTWTASPPNISSGRVEIALAGADPLTGSGILCYVRFKVLQTASGSTTINFSNNPSVLFNESINANTVGGTFSTITAPTVVINPSSAVLTKGDTLRFKVTSGGKPPYTWSSNNQIVASIDSSTGLLTALARGTTTVSVVDSLGFSNTTGSIFVNDILASLPDTAMGVSGSVDVAITTGDLTSLQALSFETRIVYDSNIVHVDTVINAGTMSSGFTVLYKDTLDTLRIAGIGSNYLSGQGTLIKIRFKAATNTTGVNTPLTFAKFQFNELGGPTASTKNGRIKIVAPPFTPVPISPADNASDVPRNLKLEWNASGEASSYRVQVATDSLFTTTAVDSSIIVDTTFTVPILSSNTKYYWRVNAKNAAGSSAFSARRTFTTGTSTTDVGLTNGAAPSVFHLEQNFPNPFNPTTTIGYQLSAISFVSLKIFDLLGREVATLVNEERSAGIYSAQWNASAFPSGVYFYRLSVWNPSGQTGLFSESKKLLLIR